MKNILSILVLVFCATAAQARQDTILPDLAPREVEITGDLSIVFPTLRRQPIVGFNPPPPVPDISSGRRPFTEAYKQPSADLPPSPLSAPEPPDVSAMATRTPIRGIVDISAGRFLDRSLDADITLISTENTSALVSATYFGTEGQDVTVGGVGTDTGRNHMSITPSLDRRVGSLFLGLGGTAFRNSYSLFGAQPAVGVPSRSSPDRTFSGYDGTISLNSEPGSSVEFHSALTAGKTSLETDVFDAAVRVDPVTTRDESYLTLKTSLSVPMQDASINVSVDGATSGLDAGSFPGSTIKSGMASASFKYLYSAKLELEAGAALMGFDSKAQRTGGTAQSLSYFSPVLRATYSLSPSVKLDIGNTPSMNTALSKDLYRLSPFMMDEPRILPSMSTIDANAGVSIQSEFVSGSARGGYRDIPFSRYPVHPAVAALGYVRGYPAFQYSDVDVLYFEASLTAVPVSGFQVGVDMLLQDASVSATDLDVPYTPSMSFGGFASATMLKGDAEFRLAFEHESKRTIDVLAATQIPSVTRIHIMWSYFFHDDYALMTGVRDLGTGPGYWDGYDFESDSFYLGLRYRW